MLIETDILLAVASKEDKYHDEAVNLLGRKGLKLSPYSLLELDLLIKSGVLDVDIELFYKGLSELLKYYGIRIALPSPLHMVKAWYLRRKYGLTYFDSLHASVAILEGIPIVSYDEGYSKVEGLAYIPPSAVR